MVIHDGVVTGSYANLFLICYRYMHIYIYITCDYKPWAYPWRRWTTTSSLSHQSFRLGKSIGSMPPGCCGDPWWTLGFGWGTLCSQCQVSCQRLPAATLQNRLQNGFLGHIPFVSYSCFFLSNASASTRIMFAESQCMSYIYIYT